MTLQKRAAIIVLILMLLLLPMMSIACEPNFNLLVENRTTQVLTIYVVGVLIGTVEPGQQITHEIPGAVGKLLLVAKNARGETVFSQTLAFDKTQQVNRNTYKVVIPPLQSD